MSAIDIIGQELRFHIKNKGMTDKGEDYEKGFIDALVHIHNLFKIQHSSNGGDNCDGRTNRNYTCKDA